MDSHRLAVAGAVGSLPGTLRISTLLPQLAHVVGNASQRGDLFGSQILNIAREIAFRGDLHAWLQKPLLRFQEMGLESFRAAVAFGRRAYFAVLAARDAVVRGDHSAVERFFVEWLELPRSKWRERLEAGVDVLLHAPLEDFGPETAIELLEWIEKRCNDHFRRGTRSLEETQLNKQRVFSIELLPAGAGMPHSPSESFLPASRSAEDSALFVLNQIEDDRLEAIMGGLDAVDAMVVTAKMLGGESWQLAAMSCGLPESDGERVRAKVTRRVNRIVSVSPGASSPFVRWPR